MNKTLCIILIFSYLFSENTPPVKGCTSPLAKNYNRDATQDDGSCIFYYTIVKGCTNPLAQNYNRDATEDDGSCISNNEDNSQKKPKTRLVPVEIIYGCMDTLACNYNMKANEDDDTCNYLDQCNICGGDNSTCRDCSGVVNGDALEDKCGVCDNDPDNDCIQDCKGDWGGNAEFDECGVCDGDNSACSGCMDTTASNYDSKAKIDNPLLCDYDLVFEESSIDGYTDREYTKIDYIAWFGYRDNEINSAAPYSRGDGFIPDITIDAIDYSSPGLSFGYEGDIYKKNNILLSVGCELMLGRQYKKDNLDFALHSIYLAPIINVPKHNIALYSRLGINILSSKDTDDGNMIFGNFQSWDYGFNAGIGIVFLINEIRILLDYNF